jgi:hypothetical protein
LASAALATWLNKSIAAMSTTAMVNFLNIGSSHLDYFAEL